MIRETPEIEPEDPPLRRVLISTLEVLALSTPVFLGPCALGRGGGGGGTGLGDGMVAAWFQACVLTLIWLLVVSFLSLALLLRFLTPMRAPGSVRECLILVCLLLLLVVPILVIYPLDEMIDWVFGSS